MTGRRGLAPCERTVNDKASWISLPPLPSFLLILLANTDGADSEPYDFRAGLQFGDKPHGQMTIHSGKAQFTAGSLRTTIGSPGTSKPYGPSDDELTK